MTRSGREASGPWTSVHTGCSPSSELETDIRNVRAAGFDGMECTIQKLAWYLAGGRDGADLVRELDGLAVTMIDVLMPVERKDGRFRDELLAECTRWSRLARELGCPALQVVALDEFAETSWPDLRAVLVESLQRLAERASTHGVRLGIEPVCFSPFYTLEQALEVIDLVGREGVGLVLDTWHLWVTGADWSEVAGIDPRDVVAVQVGDCRPRRGVRWRDADRTAFPGDGLVPLDDAIGSIARSGYRGFWSVEMVRDEHGDLLADELYCELHTRLVTALTSAWSDEDSADLVRDPKLVTEDDGRDDVRVWARGRVSAVREMGRACAESGRLGGDPKFDLGS